MSEIRHTLRTRRLGPAEVLVPTDWPRDYGFLLRVGSPGPVPLVRIHSRCAYGDVFGSMHCDCAAQLDLSCHEIQKQGGYLFYLEQEGRAAGGTIKAQAYMAQEANGVDTFDYFESLALPPDLRDYAPVARALRHLGHDRVRLLTNNLLKVDALTSVGMGVERIPLVAPIAGPEQSYIAAKRARGHLL